MGHRSHRKALLSKSSGRKMDGTLDLDAALVCEGVAAGVAVPEGVVVDVDPQSTKGQVRLVANWRVE